MARFREPAPGSGELGDAESAGADLGAVELIGDRVTLRPGRADAVVETATGRVLGTAALRLPAAPLPSADEAVPDIRCSIRPEARGQGYAAEAVRLLAQWGFVHRRLEHIEIRCDVADVAAAVTSLRAGFAYDGVRRGALKRPDGRHDLAAFSRLDTDSGAPIACAYPRLPAGGLTDGVVTLRPTSAVDATAWFEQDADALSIATGFTGLAPARIDVVRLTARAGLEWVVGSALTFTVSDVASGEFAGSIRVRMAGPPRIGGIGYAVHPTFRGRGYTARGLRLLVPWAFETAGFPRLELGAKRENVASQKAARAGGFEPENALHGRLRNGDGTFSDEIRFATLNPAAVQFSPSRINP